VRELSLLLLLRVAFFSDFASSEGIAMMDMAMDNILDTDQI